MSNPVERRGTRGESGQAAVEAALVMPLLVFVLLGCLQLGLIAQARVLAKYAAYRAVRVGAMHHADVEAMDAAAIFHLLPVIVGNDDVILPTDTASAVVTKFRRELKDNRLTVPGVSLVKTVICGPTLSELRGTGNHALDRADQVSRHGRGSRDEVDFDDPGLMMGAQQSAGTAEGLRTFNRLRLRVQLQFLYRMPIPFANWLITHIYLGSTLPSILMMGDRPGLPNQGKQVAQVQMAASRRVYVLPINVGYAMRMQSNFFLKAHPLPDANDCIHYSNN